MDFSFLDAPFLHNTAGQWLTALAALAIALLLRRPLAALLSKATARVACRLTGGRYARLFRSLVQRPLAGLIGTAALYVAITRVVWPFDHVLMHRTAKDGTRTDVTISDFLDNAALLFAVFFAALLCSRIVDFLFRAQIERARRADDHARRQVLPLLREVVKIVLWSIALLWVLGGVFGVNVPALITGLGIGGVAIALAAKESVENTFAAFVILADKPFQAGDVIKLGAVEGTVERVGFRSSRLRSLEGSVLVIPNKRLVDETLENLSQRALRRVVIRAAVRFGTLDAESAIRTVRAALEGVEGLAAPPEVVLESVGETAYTLLSTYSLPFPLAPSAEAELRGHAAAALYRALGEWTTAATPTAAPIPAPPTAG